MIRKHPLVMAALCLAVGTNAAFAASPAPSPYAGQETREIKALSVGDVDGLLQGKGMGFAKSAELNRYPGPLHALDLADELGLTAEQVETITAVRRDMTTTAARLGRDLVDAEARLDALFAEGRAEGPKVAVLLDEIGTLTAKLRFAHLKAHIEIRPVLTPHQIVMYDRLRGYAGGAGHEHGDHGGQK